MSITRYNIFARDGFRIIEEDKCGEYVFYYDHDATILFAQTEYQNISTQFAAMRLRAEKAEKALSDADIVVHPDGRVTAAFYLQGGNVIRMPLEEWKAARRNEAEKAGD